MRLVFLVGVLFAATTTAALAAPILDQSQTNFSAGASLSCSGNATTETICGQSFTVGVGGILTSVDIYLFDAVGAPSAGLYALNAAPTLLQASSTTLNFTGAGFYTFAFNVPVAVGDAIAFGLYLQNGQGTTFNLANGNPYVPGAVFAFATGGLGYVIPLNTSLDTAFRTFVDPSVPEPASLGLFGVALAGLGARRWRRRA